MTPARRTRDLRVGEERAASAAQVLGKLGGCLPRHPRNLVASRRGVGVDTKRNCDWRAGKRTRSGFDVPHADAAGTLGATHLDDDAAARVAREGGVRSLATVDDCRPSSLRAAAAAASSLARASGSDALATLLGIPRGFCGVELETCTSFVVPVAERIWIFITDGGAAGFGAGEGAGEAAEHGAGAGAGFFFFFPSDAREMMGCDFSIFPGHGASNRVRLPHPRGQA